MLAFCLRSNSDAVLGEILDAWFAGALSPEPDDRASVDEIAL